MKLFRFAENPYKPSKWVARGTTVRTDGKIGTFFFDPSRMAIRHFCDHEAIEETATAEMLMDQFEGWAFGNYELHVVDVDPDEIYSVGFGTYANLQSWNWLDTIEIHEVFVV